MALLGRGKLAIREGDWEQAMNYLTTLIDGQPEYVEGGRLLGQLYFETGNYRVSGAIFSALIQRNPRYGEAHFGLSRVLAARKQTDAALGELERAAKLGAVDFQRVRSDRAFQELWQDPRSKALEQKLNMCFGNANFLTALGVAWEGDNEKVALARSCEFIGASTFARSTALRRPVCPFHRLKAVLRTTDALT